MQQTRIYCPASICIQTHCLCRLWFLWTRNRKHVNSHDVSQSEQRLFYRNSDFVQVHFWQQLKMWSFCLNIAQTFPIPFHIFIPDRIGSLQIIVKHTLPLCGAGRRVRMYFWRGQDFNDRAEEASNRVCECERMWLERQTRPKHRE